MYCYEHPPTSIQTNKTVARQRVMVSVPDVLPIWSQFREISLHQTVPDSHCLLFLARPSSQIRISVYLFVPRTLTPLKHHKLQACLEVFLRIIKKVLTEVYKTVGTYYLTLSVEVCLDL